MGSSRILLSSVVRLRVEQLAAMRAAVGGLLLPIRPLLAERILFRRNYNFILHTSFLRSAN